MWGIMISDVIFVPDMEQRRTMDAIANSCNVALMEMAETIGIDNFIRYQHIFGFGEYTGIDLPAEAVNSKSSVYN